MIFIALLAILFYILIIPFLRDKMKEKSSFRTVGKAICVGGGYNLFARLFIMLN